MSSNSKRLVLACGLLSAAALFAACGGLEHEVLEEGQNAAGLGLKPIGLSPDAGAKLLPDLIVETADVLSHDSRRIRYGGVEYGRWHTWRLRMTIRNTGAPMSMEGGYGHATCSDQLTYALYFVRSIPNFPQRAHPSIRCMGVTHLGAGQRVVIETEISLREDRNRINNMPTVAGRIQTSIGLVAAADYCRGARYPLEVPPAGELECWVREWSEKNNSRVVQLSLL